MDIETIIVNASYLGIFLLMITNGALTFPSSQLLYIISGYFISTGELSFPLVLIAGSAGNTIGTILLYEATRRKGLEYVTRWRLFPEREVRKVSIALNKKGIWFLALGKLLPAIKVFVPIAAGIAGVPRLIFTLIMFITSAIWAIGFIAIGYYFGKSSDLFGHYSIILMLVAVIILSVFWRYVNSPEVIAEAEGLAPDTDPDKRDQQTGGDNNRNR